MLSVEPLLSPIPKVISPMTLTSSNPFKVHEEELPTTQNEIILTVVPSKPIISSSKHQEKQQNSKQGTTCLNQFQKEVNSFLGIKPKKTAPVTYQWHIKVVNRFNLLDPIFCATVLNRELEKVFRTSAPTQIIRNSFKYKGRVQNFEFDIARMEVTCKDTNKRYDLERQTLVGGRPITLPTQWEPTQSHSCQLFDVLKDTEEYNAIASSFQTSLKKGNKIEQILRIQNLVTYQQYFQSLQKIGNEKFLFHGTRNVSPRIIVGSQEGFDTRLAGNHNLWGPAIYFAEDASYVDSFAYNTPGVKQIIVASVALGSYFDYGNTCYPSLTRPPIDVERKKYHDSISGVTNDSRVYAVFNSKQCCPRYIIRYQNDAAGLNN